MFGNYTTAFTNVYIYSNVEKVTHVREYVLFLEEKMMQTSVTSIIPQHHFVSKYMYEDVEGVGKPSLALLRIFVVLAQHTSPRSNSFFRDQRDSMSSFWESAGLSIEEIQNKLASISHALYPKEEILTALQFMSGYVTKIGNSPEKWSITRSGLRFFSELTR